MKPASQPSVPTFDPLAWAGETGKAKDLLLEVKAQLRVKKKKRNRRIAGGSTLVIAALLFGWGIPTLRQTSSVETVAAQRQTLALSDGSQAELNARTSLRTDFRYGRRTVELTSGEAFFSVQKDPAHPFLVRTPHGTVRVLGTKFNVRLDAQARPEVTLIEGAVTIEDRSAAPARLAPGEQFSADAGQVRMLSATDLARATAWRQGQVVLEGLSLHEAAARFAAYHGAVIEVSPMIGSLQMGGIYPLDDLANFFSSLELALSVKVTHRADGSYLVSPR